MKILVLAGGADQCALIKELQKRGHKIILLDYLPNPPAKPLVEKHIQESTLDYSIVKDVAIKEDIDLVCTACTDQALLTVAKVSEDLGLPCYISYKQALEVTNKTYMKRKMLEGNVPTSSFHIINQYSDFDEITDLSYPLVIKPADCNSSKGVIKVLSSTECQSNIITALKMSRSHTAIIEEFVEGNEISADFYIEGHNPCLLSASYSSKIPNSSGFTITGSLYRPISDTIKNKLTSIAAQISEIFRLSETPLLVQLIKNGDNLSVIEFSARMGGGSKYRLIQEISGINIMEKYVDLILGEKPKMSPSPSSKYIQMVYVYTYPGIISNISGLEKLKKDGVIIDYFLYKALGSLIEKTETSSDRTLGFLVKAESMEDLSSKINLANNSIRIEDSNGHDIMRHDLIS